MNTPKERPIIFGADMVKAILEGRKTQTRRVIKPQPEPPYVPWGQPINGTAHFTTNTFQGEKGNPYEVACPYGEPGDRLWVREAWRIADRDYDPGRVRVEYRATHNGVATDSRAYTQLWSDWIEVGNEYAGRFVNNTDRSTNVFNKDGFVRQGIWRSPIHMPRWASRILLEITKVRVHRLSEMTEHEWGERDAMAEGFPVGGESLWGCAADWYRELWDSINAKRGHSWDSNPWVWAITFKRVEP